MYKVYIDGQVGSTGLQLRQKLQNHKEVEILLISEELRKDENERKRLMNEADVVFLCLPDDAAKEAVKLVENPNTCVIDASTAHRVNPDWAYGFPELSALHEEKIRFSKRGKAWKTFGLSPNFPPGFTVLLLTKHSRFSIRRG